MKALKTSIMRWWMLGLVALCTLNGHAQTKTASPDSLEISLLTCTPHQEVYSIYGHTAIRVHDESQHRDFVVNYGVFDFNSPHFLWRFAFAVADYEMGILTMPQFMAEYRLRGSGVTEQVLNLTAEEKIAIYDALSENARPENVKYRYNFFYDNCTTRARDIIVNHLTGKVAYHNAEPSMTFREYVHSYSEDYPWTTFGIDLLLGVRADQPTTRSESQFLPYNLRDDFEKATIRTPEGSERPLVLRTTSLLNAGPVMTGTDLPISPRTSMWLLSALILALTAMERWWWKRVLWWFDGLLMLLLGMTGLIVCALLFSKHPTVSTNLQALLFNPLPLVMLIPVMKRLRHGVGHWWWAVQSLLLVMFLVGGFFQNYAQGLVILALSLLIRWLTRVRMEKKDHN